MPVWARVAKPTSLYFRDRKTALDRGARLPRHCFSCAIRAGNLGVSAVSSEREPDFKGHLLASQDSCLALAAGGAGALAASQDPDNAA